MCSSDSQRSLDRLLVFNLATDVDHPVLGFTSDWLRSLAPLAGAIDVVTMWSGRFDLPANVQVHSVGKERGLSEARRAVEFYRILGSLLRRHRYDACFAHMMPLFAVMGAPLLRAHRVPTTLWYTHGATPPLLRLAERLVDRVVTSSSETMKVPSRKLEVIGHAIDLDAFRPLPTDRSGDDPFTVITVGRVAPIKRVEVMIEALAAVAPTLPPPGTRLRIVGPVDEADLDYAARLSDRARALGVGALVEFAGPVARADVAAEYAAADVAINLTPSGAFDKAALEAMACGLPLVTSNPDLIGEIAAEDERLALPAPEAAPLAAALRYIHSMTAEERRDLGARLRTKMQDHALDSIPQRLLAAMPRRVPEAVQS